MTNTALAATLFGPEDLRVVERDLGDLQPGMVRVRFGAGGVCGSDMHYYKHARTGDFVVKAPLVLGHEIAGTIAAISGSAPGLKVGDRVAINPSRWCGRCTYCRQDRPNLCEAIYFMGSASKWPHMQGGFSSEFDAIPAQCIRIPDHVPFEAAALGEPLAVCLHAVARAGSIKDKSVLVIGAGPIGQITLMAARRKGAGRTMVSDIAPGTLAFARRLGADETVDVSAGPEALAEAVARNPVDVVFEASGSPQGVAAAVASVRRGGTIVQIGNLPGGLIPTPTNAIMSKEIDFVGTFRFGKEYFEAVEMIADGSIDMRSIVTGRRPLTQAVEAVQLAFDRSQSMKVVVTDGA
jgi:L-idonate 5-dehydrogenase